MAVITITKDNFENEVLGAKLPVVLSFVIVITAIFCFPFPAV